MEQRKLIKLGNSSLAMALPKEWVTKSGLKKGDTIFLNMSSNGEVVMNCKYKKTSEEKIKVIDLSGVTDVKTIERELGIAYVQDYNRIHIKAEKEKQELIKKLVKNLMGLEVVECSNEKMIIRDFFSLEDINLNDFVRRMDNIIRGMFEEINLGLINGKLDQKDYLEMFSSDLEINKFYFLINRILVKGGNNPSVLSALKIDMMTLFNSWWIAYNLEHVGDELKTISTIIYEEEISDDKSKKIRLLLDKVREDYVKVLNSYYKNDREIAFEALSQKDALKMAETLSKEKESSVARIGEKLKEVRGLIHQINKIIIYNLQ